MGRKYFKPNSGYTGRLLEAELFGELTETKPFGEYEYATYKEAMRQAKKLQPHDDPTYPDKNRFASDLYATLADKLGLEDYSNLEFFTGVQGQLDYFHRVDAWFELKTPDGIIIMVTLDVSKNPEKPDAPSGNKADVEFLFPLDGLDPVLDKEEWFDKVNEVASAAFDKLILRQ